jgi:hypothetical protein
MNRKGRLQLVWLNKGRRTEPEFEVTFISYQTIEGPVKSRKFNGEESLRAFLNEEVHADARQIDSALQDLQDTGSGGLETISLSDEQLRNLKLL